MKRFFHNELDQFRSQLVIMAEKSLMLIRQSVRALHEHDSIQAQSIIDDDDDIDALEVKIDAEATRYMLLRAPVATELRLLTVGMKISHELERVGDESCTIAKRTREICAGNPLSNYFELLRMGELAAQIMRQAVDSFLDGNADQAYAVPMRDREIDALHEQNYKRITQCIEDRSMPVATALNLIFISKAYERIGDHATNIAEEVYYLVEGFDLRHSAEVRDIKRG
jgi:phosphate transport system protein